MVESFLITLREGVEAALAVGLIIVTLRKMGRLSSLSWVFGGLLLAVIGSLAGGWFLTTLPIHEGIWEGVLMMAAAILVTTTIVWMWRTSRRFSEEIQAKSSSLLGPGLFLLTFLLVLREGIETVLFLSAVGLTTEGVFQAVGVGGGVVLSLAFGAAFVRGSLRIDLSRFFALTGIVLLVLAAQLFLGGLHELSEGGLISMGPREMAIVGPIVKTNTLFLIVLLILPLLLLLRPNRFLKAEEERIRLLAGAERRLGLSKMRRERFWRLVALILSTVIIFSVSVHYAFSRGAKEIEPPLLVEAEGGVVSLPIVRLEEGVLHRFGVMVGPDMIRFLVLKKGDGTIATAFDACRICGAKGYRQEKHRFVCLNCAADINPVTIGRLGGCNPIPLKGTVEEGRLFIRLEDLKVEEALFVGGWRPEVVCPVCLMVMRRRDAGVTETYKGKTYTFCKMPHCHATFLKDPARYAR